MDSKQKKSDYDTYLALVHSNKHTPDELIDTIIKEGTGKQPLSKTKIVAGEANEVYEIALPNTENVILRISDNKEKNFKQEQWAIDQCKNIGLPVPMVLYIKEVNENGMYRAFCIQKKLPGDLLERGNIRMQDMDQLTLKKIIRKAGTLLAQMHSIKTKGFGYINDKGVGEYATYVQLLGEDKMNKEKFIQLSQHINFPVQTMNKAFDLIDGYLDRAPVISPVLNHNDFGPKHIMITGEKITGILDFGEASSHSYVNDLARWDYWHSDTVPLAWLIEGYTSVTPLTDNFNKQLQIIKIVNGLSALWWYYDQDYSKGVSQTAEKLLHDVAVF